MQTNQTSPNPFGGRLRTAIHRHAETRSRDFSGLPHQTNRFTVIKLLRQIGREVGWSGRLIDHLELLISHTYDDDWDSQGRPIVWLSVRETALRLGIGERQVRRNERRLLALGAIAFNDSANCRRFGWRDNKGQIVEAYGLDLSPCATLIPSLSIALAQAVDDRERYLRLQRQISATRRRIRAALADTLLEGREEVREAAATIEKTLATHDPVHDGQLLDRLEENVRQLEEIDHHLTGLLDGGDSSATEKDEKDENVCQARQKSPPSQTFLSAPQRTKTNPIKINPYKPASQLPRNTEPDIRQLLAIMPGVVAGGLPPNRQPDWPGIIEAARLACHPLGISPDAWGKACQILGRRGAALAVIVIAAKRDDIASPGGYLRAMTARGAAGKLNLRASLKSLHPKTKQ